MGRLGKVIWTLVVLWAIVALLCWQSSGAMAQVAADPIAPPTGVYQVPTSSPYVMVNSRLYVNPTLIGLPYPVVPNEIPNFAVSDVMTGPWYLDHAFRTDGYRDTFVQEYYYFHDIPMFNPYAFRSPSGGYRFLEDQLR